MIGGICWWTLHGRWFMRMEFDQATRRYRGYWIPEPWIQHVWVIFCAILWRLHVIIPHRMCSLSISQSTGLIFIQCLLLTCFMSLNLACGRRFSPIYYNFYMPRVQMAFSCWIKGIFSPFLLATTLNAHKDLVSKNIYKVSGNISKVSKNISKVTKSIYNVNGNIFKASENIL